MDAACEMAREILDGAPLSVAAARESVMLATEMGRTAALDAAWAAHEIAYNSDDAQEGPLAFSQKRKPEWKGR
jgi:1,4-dihydroxy-2-naphthoyl-CoA synthase